MTDYHPATCYLCDMLPLADCDACGNQICFSHRSETGPRPNGNGARLDYCTQCLTETNDPGPLPLP